MGICICPKFLQYVKLLDIYSKFKWPDMCMESSPTYMAIWVLCLPVDVISKVMV